MRVYACVCARDCCAVLTHAYRLVRELHIYLVVERLFDMLQFVHGVTISKLYSYPRRFSIMRLRYVKQN